MSPVIAPAALPSATLSAPAAVVQKAKPAPHGWTTYTVRAGDTLAAIAARTSTTTGVLASRNHLKNGGNHLSLGQHLSVPKTAAQARAEAARAKAAAAARAAAIKRSTYVVRSGDTLSHIAARKGVSLAALLKANRLSSRSVLQVGQKLRIPGAGAASAHRPAAAAVSTTTYRVRSGDTLSAIATRTKTSLATMYSLNRLNPRSVIHPGQVLKVRGTTPAATRPAGTAAYQVRVGDTLSGIATKNSVTLAALLKTNRLSAASVIYPGQRLKVPAKPAKSAASANSFAGRTYPSSIVNAANRNRSALAHRGVPSRSQTKAMIVATARRHGVDPKLALAVGWQESGWNQRQVSVANAIGVMQVIPSSGQWASEMAGRKLNLLNTQDNITAGVVILRSLTRSAANLDQAIGGYYQGLYSVQHNGMYADTKVYVASIKAHRGRM
ncbi:lytic transglycosylase domain-containing protein [Pedococcus bigeumensis]|uniref:LysM peptidoglycan-binding domain-containing protein n=1 Tax=Pedococcus bigeumensis TaxID=433644 RepID=A0A502D2N1_9MICO|nr:lytic transglycosylase domain-containing protein [Pedococcus bigeumensis]TPG18271.1 LysM peptidoglycan-binding domain-containing protein [Pedococcus bigeumensis]